jgi:4-amino-4-deoxy-L-arabinose transferase-like glycosyltransferase
MTEDDDLRARLRRADPAASLPPAAPGRVSRLMGETMTSATAVVPRSAGRRWWFALAAGLVLIAAAGAGWLVSRPDPVQVDTMIGVVSSAPPAVVSLKAAGVAAKCREPKAEDLASYADFAFAGTVVGVVDKVVTLQVTQVYRGGLADLVRVAQEGGSSEQMLGSGTFETGKKYLVASSEGGILVCGYSGEADAAGLQEMYDKAF